MASRIDRILATVPAGGCKLKTLRRVLWDIKPAPLDYALQGLIESGRLLIVDGFVRPAGAVAAAVAAMPARTYRPGPSHPWKQLLAVQKERR